MQSSAISIISILFCLIGSYVIVSNANPRLSIFVQSMMSFLISGVIVGSWYTACKLNDLVFGVVVIGWREYLSQSVYIVESQRHAIYLSDGRIIVEPTRGYFSMLFGLSFFIIIIGIFPKVVDGRDSLKRRASFHL